MIANSDLNAGRFCYTLPMLYIIYTPKCPYCGITKTMIRAAQNKVLNGEGNSIEVKDIRTNSSFKFQYNELLNHAGIEDQPSIIVFDKAIVRLAEFIR